MALDDYRMRSRRRKLMRIEKCSSWLSCKSRLPLCGGQREEFFVVVFTYAHRRLVDSRCSWFLLFFKAFLSLDLTFFRESHFTPDLNVYQKYILSQTIDNGFDPKINSFDLSSDTHEEKFTNEKNLRSSSTAIDKKIFFFRLSCF